MSTAYPIVTVQSWPDGNKVFLTSDETDLKRVEETLPAVLDYNASGENYRIEIHYIRSVSAELGKTIKVSSKSSENGIVLQVSSDDPVSSIVFNNVTTSKHVRNTTGDAWLLENSEGHIVGIEIAEFT